MTHHRITKQQASHIVARVSGVTASDTKAQAARKAIDTMRRLGMSKRAIAQAERMYDELVRKGH